MGLIGNFIKKLERKVIGRSDDAIHALEVDWKVFLEEGTYMVYDKKQHLNHLIRKAKMKVSVPWYFFWNFKLKKRVKVNEQKLMQYPSLIQKYNPEFVAARKKQYADLFVRDKLVLDDDQQTAVITDDTHNLVVAGAGSGKTEVLITRVAYLVKREPDTIDPKRILALAFQNKAANEIKERLKKRYRIDVEIRTFHALGKKIIEDAAKIKGNKLPKLKLECAEDWKFNRYISKLFDREVSSDKKLQNSVINYMKSYGDDEVILTKEDFKKKEEFYEYQRNLRYTALDGTKVKSEAEREILNFFLMHKLNGRDIKVLYEHPAEWMKYTDENGEDVVPEPDFYFPEHDIYLEHWALNKDGKVPEWFEGENPTEKYVQTMKLKKKSFEEHKKRLIETAYKDYQRSDFLEKLSTRFLEALKEAFPDQKFELTPLTYQQLVEAVWESAKSVKQMPLNLARFITIAKTYGLDPSDVEKRLRTKRWSPKQSGFGSIASRIFRTYQQDLEKTNSMDYSDMINIAVKYLNENKELYENQYEHILIDEYQDVSTQRYNLIKALLNKNKGCKLFCVGDDWQSIMGFAGSNLDFFIHFEEYFLHPARTDLTKNYRSIKSIVDVGSEIIKNNKDGQIQKKTLSNTDKELPIQIYASKHQKKYFSQYYEQIAKHSLDKIKEYYDKGGYQFDDFMILMRITNKKKLRNFITDYAKHLGIPIADEPDIPGCVHIMSVHKSKGLQARVVIILNVDKDLYGFPCELEDPEIFEPAILNNDRLRKQEERRLFYVAVTRAKEEVIMYTQKDSESEFITEIKDFTKREELGY